MKKKKAEEEKDIERKRRKQVTPMQISQEMVLGSSDEEVIYLEAQGPPPE